MGCKPAKIHVVPLVDVKQPNKVEFHVSERKNSKANVIENDKPIGNIAEEFHLEPSNKTTEEFHLEPSNKITEEFHLEPSNKITEELHLEPSNKTTEEFHLEPSNKITEELHLEPSNKTTEEHIRPNSTTSQGSGRISQEHIVTDQLTHNRRNEINTQRVPLGEFHSEPEESDKADYEPVFLCERKSVGAEEVNNERFSSGKTTPEQLENVNEEHMPWKKMPTDIDLTPIDKHAFTSTVCQQRQAAIDNMSFRRTIDQWQPKSVVQLVNSIKKLAADRNEIEQAWIIFYWVSQNIRYDTEAYFSRKIGAQTSQNVILSGRAVCEGYSVLYADLCNQIGLRCRKVSGYAKGYSFNPRQTSFEKTNHAWNILTLNNGHSYFVESTWGSGQADSSTRQYKKNLVPFYFFCRPEHMIYKHLPEDPQYQLLAHPLAMKQYLMLPCAYDTFFELHLNIVSPICTPKITLKSGKKYGEILIATPDDVTLSGSLRDKSGTKVEGGDFVFFDRDQKLWQCRFAPQKAGQHEILIFAGKKSDSKTSTLDGAVKFILDIDHLPAPTISYPHIWPEFFDHHLEIITPIDSRYVDWPIDKNRPYCEILVRSPDDVRLSARIKNCLSNKTIENGTLVNFDSQSKLWQCLFAPRANKASYELTLFACRGSGNQSQCVVQFNLEKTHRPLLSNSVHFPLTYSSFTEAKCHLFEPLHGVLKPGSTIKFHCQIPGAYEVKVTVDGQWLKVDSSSYAHEKDIFRREIKVGHEEVAVWVKFDKEQASYDGLLKYFVK
ncbi:unnamed protein product [Adineta steineri]|uniref:Transglutaminase-like domain-containing protein n=1 Tax=Adineta steineri TaxID=433720 RepID=A0A819Y5W9_9BILA|nr:unnamed protein product [Adineta steineri]CAF4145170.1 unnamed protein product [Adineta steineri]